MVMKTVSPHRAEIKLRTGVWQQFESALMDWQLNARWYLIRKESGEECGWRQCLWACRRVSSRGELSSSANWVRCFCGGKNLTFQKYQKIFAEHL